mmetsp:Transcript_36230/g.82583  ORF Transcript_36230/g.82583 Transcript_36230/m.82583 type:complete len:221 (-) Transcript_36230:95-757(-)|eukprot:CAMPEP_0114539884 /NCGR_PEP_ID=MMETSP0114-20121206/475_1 /TAXON_ID=31324 /ORGANISM="Goniomonas sp, Strain m" /LENGTH=220 /DNA_ID=CAMNT_0001724015 /DNA_START=61 /DNA_END=723 /DNA_ORIENTATION=+
MQKERLRTSEKLSPEDAALKLAQAEIDSLRRKSAIATFNRVLSKHSDSGSVNVNVHGRPVLVRRNLWGEDEEVGESDAVAQKVEESGAAGHTKHSSGKRKVRRGQGSASEGRLSTQPNAQVLSRKSASERLLSKYGTSLGCRSTENNKNDQRAGDIRSCVPTPKAQIHSFVAPNPRRETTSPPLPSKGLGDDFVAPVGASSSLVCPSRLPGRAELAETTS